MCSPTVHRRARSLGGEAMRLWLVLLLLNFAGECGGVLGTWYPCGRAEDQELVQAAGDMISGEMRCGF